MIATTGRAQTTASSSFEVASVRLSPRGHGYTSISPSGAGQFSAKNASMKLLLEMGGAKLQKGRDNPATAYILPDGLRGSNLSTRTLAGMLASPVGEPVVDRRGITGNYDVDLKFAPNGAADSQLPSIFTAVQEQLGLKLEPQKVSMEMVVIDHLDKLPSEN